MGAGRVSGEFHAGRWEDIGTPQRLAALDDELNAASGDAVLHFRLEAHHLAEVAAQRIYRQSDRSALVRRHHYRRVLLCDCNRVVRL